MSFVPTLLLIAQKVCSIAIGLVGLGLLVTVHEFGHFIFCKLFGVLVPSFSIGFGRSIWEKQIGETTFRLSWLPLGGYVEIAGNEEVGQGEQKEAGRTDERSMRSKPFWQKACIVGGGIFANFVFAYLVLAAVFFIGMPKTPLFCQENTPAIIESIESKSRAEQAGLKAGDAIVSYNGIDAKKEGLCGLLSYCATQKKPLQLSLIIEREKTPINITWEVGNAGPKASGVSFKLAEMPRKSFIESLRDAYTTTIRIIRSAFSAFYQLIKQRSTHGLGGPVMIIAATASGAEHGLSIFFLLIAFISINLAVLNLLPLPIFDGGQIFIMAIEAIIRRELPLKVKMAIAYTCWILILGLFIFLSAQDIWNLFLRAFGS